jgi:ribosomal protein S19
LQQAKLRSQIRIDDGRAKPIDLLAKYVSAEDDDYAIEMQEPYTYLGGLTVEDLEDLLEDIKVYKELEQGKNVQYWEDITIIVDDELQRLQKMEAAARDEMIRDRRQGINNSVVNDVASVFKGKTHSQLELLESQVRKKLQGGEGVDVGYWESLLQQLLAHMALTRLRERHQENLRRKLFKLKEEQGIENQNLLFPIVKQDGDSPSPSPTPGSGSPKPGVDCTNNQPGSSRSAPEPGTSQDPDQNEDQEEEEVAEEETNRYDEYIQGSYTPKLLQPGDLDIDVIIYDPEDDMKKLEYMRKQVKVTGQVKDDTETEFVKKAKEGMNDDEAQFSVELALEQQSFLWSDKYRPRKPRFFNRVHTGFEWNKYNQTHYDIDNPPPKIVQGYKFNIFYPDLIDKSQTPQYTLTPIEDEPDFAMLKFIAGPPYEAIAFKVVNREWEYSWKRGFRCQFHNNIFQLWYHFKRYRYRR